LTAWFPQARSAEDRQSDLPPHSLRRGAPENDEFTRREAVGVERTVGAPLCLLRKSDAFCLSVEHTTVPHCERNGHIEGL
jgi:hypothetical protein